VTRALSASYYIYYRVDMARAGHARRVVEALQQEVLDLTGVAGRLLQRRDDPSTWMEIYEDVADEAAFASSLERAVERSGVAKSLAVGSRRVTETFLPF